MTLSEIIDERLEGVKDDLPPGSRVLISTSEPCGCGNAPRSPHQTCCHVCNGTGVVIDALTLWGEQR